VRVQLLGDGLDDAVLVLEIIEQQALGHARAAGDLGDGGGLDSLGGDKGSRGIKQCTAVVHALPFLTNRST